MALTISGSGGGLTASDVRWATVNEWTHTITNKTSASTELTEFTDAFTGIDFTTYRNYRLRFIVSGTIAGESNSYQSNLNFNFVPESGATVYKMYAFAFSGYGSTRTLDLVSGRTFSKCGTNKFCYSEDSTNSFIKNTVSLASSGYVSLSHKYLKITSLSVKVVLEGKNSD